MRPRVCTQIMWFRALTLLNFPWPYLICDYFSICCCCYLYVIQLIQSSITFSNVCCFWIAKMFLSALVLVVRYRHIHSFFRLIEFYTPRTIYLLVVAIVSTTFEAVMHISHVLSWANSSFHLHLCEGRRQPLQLTRVTANKRLKRCLFVEIDWYLLIFSEFFLRKYHNAKQNVGCLEINNDHLIWNEVLLPSISEFYWIGSHFT